ncbi:MAG TPA: hypothetical protein VKU91_00245 [Acidimicrobiales bacterium]|nr:hypothetical protein [Acidimicrobiales bacterium]
MPDPTDPRHPQQRLAVTPSGRAAWVTITGDDRLQIIRQLPSRWPEVIIARERGDPLEQIATWAKCPPPCKPSCRLKESGATADQLLEAVDRGWMPEHQHVGEPCLSWLIAECYAYVETQIQDLANKRARLMV